MVAVAVPHPGEVGEVEVGGLGEHEAVAAHDQAGDPLGRAPVTDDQGVDQPLVLIGVLEVVPDLFLRVVAGVVRVDRVECHVCGLEPRRVPVVHQRLEGGLDRGRAYRHPDRPGVVCFPLFGTAGFEIPGIVDDVFQNGPGVPDLPFGHAEALDCWIGRVREGDPGFGDHVEPSRERIVREGRDRDRPELKSGPRSGAGRDHGRCGENLI